MHCSCHGPRAQRGGAVGPSCVTACRHPWQVQLQGGFVQRSPSPWEGREEQPHLSHASSALPCTSHQQEFLFSSSLPCTSCIPVPLVPRRSSWFGCWESSCLWGSCAAWHTWVVWAGGLLAGSFLAIRFILWRTLEFSAVQPLSWDQHSPARSGPCHSKPIFRCGARRLQQEWSPRVI